MYSFPVRNELTQLTLPSLQMNSEIKTCYQIKVSMIAKNNQIISFILGIEPLKCFLDQPIITHRLTFGLWDALLVNYTQNDHYFQVNNNLLSAGAKDDNYTSITFDIISST